MEWRMKEVVAIATSSIALLGTNCAPLHDIPLVWRPTTQLSEEGDVKERTSLRETRSTEEGTVETETERNEELDGGKITDLSGVGEATVKVDTLTDTRKNPDRIGENQERSKVRLVTTRDNVADWCTDRLKFLLEQYGLDLVNENANFTITGQVRRFYVVEVNTYEGDVGLKLEVRNHRGELVWSGMTSGVSNRFGRSYKDENYYETLSDAFMQAVQKLNGNQNFKKALSTR